MKDSRLNKHLIAPPPLQPLWRGGETWKGGHSPLKINGANRQEKC